MDDEPPSINLSSSNQVASRFISSNDLETARLKREQEWKATYERLGQEAPPMPKEEYDGRSLYEKLMETKNKKREAFEEQLKFKNQFRALDNEEIEFLDDAAQEKRIAEMKREQEIQEEMENFKKALASRATEPLPVVASLLNVTATCSNGDPTSEGQSCSVKSSALTPLPPKKTKKTKNYLSTFLAGAIRPKDNAKASAKKRKFSTDSGVNETEKVGFEHEVAQEALRKPEEPLQDSNRELSQSFGADSKSGTTTFPPKKMKKT